jgi:hypothetical protein
VCNVVTAFIDQILLRNPTNEEVPKYAFRAIGHLANEHPENRTRFSNVGACEQVLLYMQRFLNSVPITGEGCWALRNLAVDFSLLERLVLGNVCELMCSVLFRHSESEVVVIEALRVVCVLCGDNAVPQTASSTNKPPNCSARIHVGLLRSLARAVPRNMGNADVMTWLCRTLIAVASSEDITKKFIDAKYCEIVVELLQSFAGKNETSRCPLFQASL